MIIAKVIIAIIFLLVVQMGSYINDSKISHVMDDLQFYCVKKSCFFLVFSNTQLISKVVLISL